MNVPKRQYEVNDERDQREPTPNASIGSEPAHSGSIRRYKVEEPNR